jgi:ParB family transcriptional regulator, chromosome partitioning protein
MFIGAKAYRQAAGVIVRDLFDEDGGGYFTDVELLNRMVREKLNAVAVAVIGEGWKWVTVEPEFDYDRAGSMRRIWPEPKRLSDEDQAKLDALEAQYEELCDQRGENEEVEGQLDRLETEIAALQGEEVYQPEEIAVAGAFVSLGHDGEPRIERGYLRPEDAQRADAAEGKAVPRSISLKLRWLRARRLRVVSALPSPDP